MPDFKKYRCMECEYIYDRLKEMFIVALPQGHSGQIFLKVGSATICGAPKSFFKLIESS